MNMNFKRKLPIPLDIKNQFPLTAEMAAVKEANDSELKAVLNGTSNKFVLIIGPCSADSAEPVLEYISRLAAIRERVSDKLVIIPRIYTNKPRTAGDGYKGMLHQPDPAEKPDMLHGVISLRDLNMRALRDHGFSCADELLYPDSYRYLSDLLSYVAVGARSVENQQHRLTASGLDVPVGMKNPVSGDIDGMLNAISAAQHGHTFIYRGWEVESSGNEYAHAVLRGAYANGEYIPNYGYDSICALGEKYLNGEYENPACIVDCSHANSGKDCFLQPEIALDVLTSRERDSGVKKLVKGLMVESYLLDGAQKIGDGVYGKSITDSCLGWEKTEKLINDIYAAL